MPDYDPRPKILVVDDTPMHRQILLAVLADRDYQIVEAEGGMQGISMAFWEMPDLIISDVMMPDISGYQLCRFLKNDSLTVGIPIILMTATELGKQDRFWGLRSGADRYVAKDRVRDLLLDEVDALLSQVVGGRSRKKADRDAAGASRAERTLQREMGSLFDKLLFRTTIAHEARQLSSFVYDEDKCLTQLGSLIGDLVDCACVCVHLAGPEGARVRIVAADRLSQQQLELVLTTVADETASELPAAGDTDRIRPSPEELVDPLRTDSGFAAHEVLPMQMKLDLLGSISLFFADARSANAADMEHLRLLTQEFAPVAQLLNMYQENQRLSVTDGLTRVYNVRYFRQRLEEAFENFKRYERPFSVVMIDVDFFKQINDEHGHPAGDAVLQYVAEVLRDGVRRGDVVARYGGDEFALLLTETRRDGARTLAERLWTRLRSGEFEWRDRSLRITTSIGVGEATASCEDSSAALAKADAALYEAKRAGRDAVRVADEA